MRALEFDGTATKVVDRAEPAALEGRAIVRMTRAGICNTDLELARGYMDFRGVLGHELVGVVEEGPKVWLGKRVTAEINFACGDDECEACADGLGRHCPKRTVMGILGADGAFAEKVSVPVANLHLVPEGVDDDQAVFTEPLAAAFEILDQVKIEGGTRCVVLGDGKLGMLVAQVLASTGAHVIAVGKHEEKLAVLNARGIPTMTLDMFQRARRRRADVVVEATGTAAGFEAAVAMTRPRGTLVLKSTVADAVPMKLAPVVVDEITIVGSRCGRFTPALEALEAGTIDVTPLVSARYPLARADEALAHAAKKGTLKVILEA